MQIKNSMTWMDYKVNYICLPGLEQLFYPRNTILQVAKNITGDWSHEDLLV